MVWGGRRSPLRHPLRSDEGRGGGSGKSSDGRAGKGIGGRNVDGGSRSNALVGKNGGSSGGNDRRFSLTGLEGLAEIGDEGKRLVYVRSLGKTGCANVGCTISLAKDEDQEVVSRVEPDSASITAMEERGTFALDSSDLDETMEILGGSDAEEFLKELENRTGALNQGVEDMDVVGSSMMDAMAIGSEEINVIAVEDCKGDIAAVRDDTEQMDSGELKFNSVEKIEVSKMVLNPMFEPNNLLFKFGGRGRIEDLGNEALCCNIKEGGMDVVHSLKEANVDFGMLGKFPENTGNWLVKGKGIDSGSCERIDTAARISSGCENASTEEFLSQKLELKS